MFRKLFFIMLCLLLLPCVGCGDMEETVAPAESNESTAVSEQSSETEPTSETTQPTEYTELESSETEEITEPTEEVFSPIDSENPVIEAFSASVTKGKPAMTYTCSLPQIQCESSYAQTVNQELSDFYYNYLDDEGAWHGGNKSFDWYVNDDILSLIIYHYNTENPSDYEADFRHSIYNLHMSDGSKVGNDEILELAGVTVEDFRARARQILGNNFILCIPSEIAKAIYDRMIAAPETAADSFDFDMFCATVSDENLDLIGVFLGEDVALHFMGRRYYIAGGFDYCTPLFDYFAEFEVSPYYETMIAHIP